MRRSALLLILILCLAALPSFAQQDYIARYSTFTAFSYLSTPSLNLVQRGIDADFGVNMRSWLTVGGDFSYNAGSSSILPGYLSSSAQAKLAPIIPLLPPGFVLAVPYSTTTYTYEAGPQFNYRKEKKFTYFARPALGALHSTFTAQPGACQQPQLQCQAILTKVVAGLVGPSLSKSDTVVFYGFGGGVTWEVAHSFGLRIAADYVRFNFFSDLLNGSRGSVRVTVGTKFNFGKNILAK
jgi:hypothetical protein